MLIGTCLVQCQGIQKPRPCLWNNRRTFSRQNPLDKGCGTCAKVGRAIKGQKFYENFISSIERSITKRLIEGQDTPVPLISVTNPNYSPIPKTDRGGAWGSRMILQTAVSQERHHPKTSASGCPGTVPTGRMAIIGHNASSQPPQAYRKLFALTPRRSPRRFPGPARLDARTPTRSNCASIPAPPGTTRVTIS
jgi:hypothetical protein